MSYQHYVSTFDKISKPFTDHIVLMQSMIVEAMATTYKTDNVQVIQKILQLSNPVITLGNNGEKIYYRIEKEGSEDFLVFMCTYENELH